MTWYETVPWWPTPIWVRIESTTHRTTICGPGWRITVGYPPEKQVIGEGPTLKSIETSLDRMLERFREAQETTIKLHTLCL